MRLSWVVVLLVVPGEATTLIEPTNHVVSKEKAPERAMEKVTETGCIQLANQGNPPKFTHVAEFCRTLSPCKDPKFMAVRRAGINHCGVMFYTAAGQDVQDQRQVGVFLDLYQTNGINRIHCGRVDDAMVIQAAEDIRTNTEKEVVRVMLVPYPNAPKLKEYIRTTKDVKELMEPQTVDQLLQWSHQWLGANTEYSLFRHDCQTFSVEALKHFSPISCGHFDRLQSFVGLAPVAVKNFCRFYTGLGDTDPKSGVRYAVSGIADVYQASKDNETVTAAAAAHSSPMRRQSTSDSNNISSPQRRQSSSGSDYGSKVETTIETTTESEDSVMELVDESQGQEDTSSDSDSGMLEDEGVGLEDENKQAILAAGGSTSDARRGGLRRRVVRPGQTNSYQ